MPQFQFLIGRLETIPRLKLHQIAVVFQFLIGRLETVIDRLTVTGDSLRFQFLIGRLETKMQVGWWGESLCFNSS